jgi:thymidylate synthase
VVLTGSSDATLLGDKNVRIWEPYICEFLDNVGMEDLPVGDTGPLYGHTLHYCGAACINKYTDYTGQGVDQLKNVIDSIKNDPYGVGT